MGMACQGDLVEVGPPVVVACDAGLGGSWVDVEVVPFLGGLFLRRWSAELLADAWGQCCAYRSEDVCLAALSGSPV
jgi:hypothetical protein